MSDTIAMQNAESPNDLVDLCSISSSSNQDNEQDKDSGSPLLNHQQVPKLVVGGSRRSKRRKCTIDYDTDKFGEESLEDSRGLTSVAWVDLTSVCLLEPICLPLATYFASMMPLLTSNLS